MTNSALASFEKLGNRDNTSPLAPLLPTSIGGSMARQL
jgi:hypothetical protein